MPRCPCPKPAFIKNRCRFGNFAELQSGLEMALASNRQWKGSINRFWNAFGSHFAPPTWVPLDSNWASNRPHGAPFWSHLKWPHWVPFAPNLEPLGPCQLHGLISRPGTFELHSCMRGPFEDHLSSISDPCWLHLDHICIPLNADRQTRSHTDRPRTPDMA